jgi:hypothetical protein
MLDREYLNVLSHVLHGAVLISRLSAQPIQDFTEVLKAADSSNAHKNKYARTYSSSKHTLSHNLETEAHIMSRDSNTLKHVIQSHTRTRDSNPSFMLLVCCKGRADSA